MEKSIPEIHVIAPDKGHLRGEELRALINAELERFNLLLIEKDVGGALSRVERAVLATYIAWKLVEDVAKEKGPETGSL